MKITALCAESGSEKLEQTAEAESRHRKTHEIHYFSIFPYVLSNQKLKSYSLVSRYGSRYTVNYIDGIPYHHSLHFSIAEQCTRPIIVRVTIALALLHPRVPYAVLICKLFP